MYELTQTHFVNNFSNSIALICVSWISRKLHQNERRKICIILQYATNSEIDNLIQKYIYRHVDFLDVL